MAFLDVLAATTSTAEAEAAPLAIGTLFLSFAGGAALAFLAGHLGPKEAAGPEGDGNSWSFARGAALAFSAGHLGPKGAAGLEGDGNLSFCAEGMATSTGVRMQMYIVPAVTAFIFPMTLLISSLDRTR